MNCTNIVEKKESLKTMGRHELITICFCRLKQASRDTALEINTRLKALGLKREAHVFDTSCDFAFTMKPYSTCPWKDKEKL
jgi:hypothetical protein